MILGQKTVTRLRAPLVAAGSEAAVWDWANAAELDILGCNGPQPLSTQEFIVDREYSVSHKRVFAPPGTDVLATDRVRIDGTVYEVEGDARPWENIASVPHHVEFDVKITKG